MDVTYNFTAGTRAVAQQVNTNFADVKSAVDVLETDVADLQAEVSGFSFIKADGSVDFTRLQSYKTYTVSNATNATPIVVTAVAHSFETGDKVFISGVGGNTAANGIFTITKIGVDTFSLDGSVGNGAFTTNGTAVIYPSADDNLVNKAYVDNTNIIPTGTCTTASTTQEKQITISGLSSLSSGQTIYATFTNENNCTTTTINANSLGAKPLVDLKGNYVGYLPANTKIPLFYDGTNWVSLFTNTSFMIPDYTNRISKSINTIYQAKCDGFIHALINTAGGTGFATQISNNSNMSTILISTNNFVNGSSGGGWSCLPIAKGQYYIFSASSYSDFFGYFSPLKGAV